MFKHAVRTSIGLLLGIVVVAVIQPITSAGAIFLIVTVALIVILLSLAVDLAIRQFRKREA